MKKTKKILSLVLAVLMCFSYIFIPAKAADFVPRVTEPSVSSPYWIHTSHGGLNSCVIASGNSVLPNCVGYAWGRAYEILDSEPDLSRLNAGEWFGINKNKYDNGNGGYPYSIDITKPKLGAIACWSETNNAGHVAVVEKINGDQITTSESGWNSARFWTKERNTTHSRLGQGDTYTFQGYIYLLDDSIQTGDIIEFGSYPQTEVKDEATISALNDLAPDWDKWTSYGYYSGDGNVGSMKQGDWMRYTDVTYNGAKYRGVRFTQYRPQHTWKKSSASNDYQYTNGYETNKVYWFKFDPIKWKVLDPDAGLVLSELLIDSQAFNNELYGNGNVYSEHYGDAEKKNKANKYETSSIRVWLNTDFYNTAFNDAEKKKMLSYGNVPDRVILPSTEEVANDKYGFNSNGGSYDEARKGVGSDYAKSQGLYSYESGTYKGNSYWILRTSGSYSAHCKEVTYACNITKDFGLNVAVTNNGIRPAIILKNVDVNAPCKHTNSVNKPQLDPNCIDIGFTAGVYCNDCETWLSGHETIAVSDHRDNNKDGKCDTCLKNLSKPDEPETPKKNIIQIIVDGVKNVVNNIVNFFKKLFRI